MRVFPTDIFFATSSLDIQAGDPYLKSRSCPQSEMENNWTAVKGMIGFSLQKTLLGMENIHFEPQTR